MNTEPAADFGQRVRIAVAGLLGAPLDDPDPFELTQPLGQQAVRQAGSTGGDLPEGAAAGEQVAQDDRCPAFRDDL